MRALQVFQLGDPVDVLQVASVPSPEPGPSQVRIRVAAAALNFADDLVCRGRYQVKPALPFTPGMEVAGTVVAAGPAARARKGQRVMALAALPHGGFAEEALAEDVTTYPIPDSLSDVEAAALLVTYQTAHVALHRRGALREGEWLLVHAGAGGVGSAAIQLGKAAGARVIATAGGPAKTKRCTELGADVVVDHRREDFAPVVARETGGRGADLIFDPVGGDTFERSRKCIAFEGRLLVIGFASGKIPEAPANHVLLKNYSIVGVHFSRYASFNPGVLDAATADLIRMHAEGLVRPSIDGLLELEEIPQALSRLAGGGTTGKLVAQIGSTE